MTAKQEQRSGTNSWIFVNTSAGSQLHPVHSNAMEMEKDLTSISACGSTSQDLTRAEKGISNRSLTIAPCTKAMDLTQTSISTTTEGHFSSESQPTKVSVPDKPVFMSSTSSNSRVVVVPQTQIVDSPVASNSKTPPFSVTLASVSPSLAISENPDITDTLPQSTTQASTSVNIIKIPSNQNMHVHYQSPKMTMSGEITHTLSSALEKEKTLICKSLATLSNTIMVTTTCTTTSMTPVTSKDLSTDNVFMATSLDPSAASPYSLAGLVSDVVEVVSSPTTSTSGTEVPDPQRGSAVLKCDECSYTSSNKHYLKQHVDLVHNAVRPYKCPFCDYAGKRSHALREHLIVHSNERPYECPHCNATFRKKGHLTNHFKLHQKGSFVVCMYCRETVPQKELEKHNASRHPTMFMCQVCHVALEDEQKIIQHIKSHNKSQQILVCSSCNFMTRNFEDFFAHAKTHQTDTEEAHRAVSSISQTSPIPKSSANLPSYSEHLVSTAASKAPVAMGVTTSPKVKATSSHEDHSGATKQPLLKCSECGYVCSSQDAMETHMWTHIKNMNRMEQRASSKATAAVKNRGQEGSLSIGIPNKTSGPSPKPSSGKCPTGVNQVLFKCSDCEFVGANQDIFLKHMLTHLPALTDNQLESVMKEGSSLMSKAMAPKGQQQKGTKVIRSETVPVSIPEASIVPQSSLDCQGQDESGDTSSSWAKEMRPVDVRQDLKHSILARQAAKRLHKELGVAFTLAAAKTMDPRDVPPFVYDEIDSRYVCTICGYKCEFQRTIKAHIWKHSGNQAVQYPMFQKGPRHPYETTPTPPEQGNNTVTIQITPASMVTSTQKNLDEKKTVDMETEETPKVKGQCSVSAAAPALAHLLAARAMTGLREKVIKEDTGNTKKEEEIKSMNSSEAVSPGAPKTTVSNPVNIDDKNEIQISEVMTLCPPTSAENNKKEGTGSCEGAREEDIVIEALSPSMNEEPSAETDSDKESKDVSDENKDRKAISYCDKDSNTNSNAVSNDDKDIKTVSNVDKDYKTASNDDKDNKAVSNDDKDYKTVSNDDKDYKTISNDDDKDNKAVSNDDKDYKTVSNDDKDYKTVSNDNDKDNKSVSNDDKDYKTVSSDDKDNKTVSSDDKAATGCDKNNKSASNVNISGEEDSVGNQAQTQQLVVETIHNEGSGGVVKRILLPIGRGIKRGGESGSQDSMGEMLQMVKRFCTEETGAQQRVVVEIVRSDPSNFSSLTGMSSQQGSPRGLANETDCEQALSEGEQTTTDSGFLSDSMSQVSIVTSTSTKNVKAGLGKKQEERKDNTEDENEVYMRVGVEEVQNDDYAGPLTRKRTASTAESAATLLSLLKKGPNQNPACPVDNKLSLSNTETKDIDTSRAKSNQKSKGISSSLLAVIEQLRERARSEVDTEEPTPKRGKRKARQESAEELDAMESHDNVERVEEDEDVRFRCKICHYSNGSTIIMRQHMRLHKEKLPHECSLCHFLGASSQDLQDHMIQHCKVRTYQCKLCSSAFNYKSQLRAHMRAHNDLFTCEDCDYETNDPFAMNSHTNSCHTFACSQCGHTFPSRQELKSHRKFVCGSTLVEDPKENTQPVSPGSREAKKWDGRGKTYRCKLCGFTSSSASQYGAHCRTHSSSARQEPLQCQFCDFLAVSSRSLKSHMKRHVNDQRFVQQPLEQYKCNLCGYVCHHLPSLKSHMWRHASDANYSYEFTNEVINAAIDFDTRLESSAQPSDIEDFNRVILEKLRARLESQGLDESKLLGSENEPRCWVTFRCCQCGYEVINKAQLSVHMKSHSDIIRWTLQVGSHDK